MIITLIEILIIVLINGVFIAAEYAFSRYRIIFENENRSQNSFQDKIFIHLFDKFDRFVSLVNIGFISCGILLGWISKEFTLKSILYVFSLMKLSTQIHIAELITFPISLLLIITIYLVFGYHLPKAFGKKYPTEICKMVVYPIFIFYVILFPIIFIMGRISNTFIELFDLSNQKNNEKSNNEELMFLIEESSKHGSIDETDHKIIENVFEFKEISVNEIMIPRNKVVGIEINQTIDEVMVMIVEQGYSRLPVYEKTLDKIVGIIYSKDLISISMNKNLIILQDVIRKPFFISEETKINLLLREFQKNRLHIAIVLDKFGGTAGIVTLEDILEELVGDIGDEYDEESKSFELTNDGKYIINALTPIHEANDLLPFDFPESEDYNTIAGFILRKTGYIPEENETIRFPEYEINVLKRTKRKIELISINQIEKSAD